MADWDRDYGGIFSTSIFGGRDRLLPGWDSTEALSALEDQGRYPDRGPGEERLWPESLREMESEAIGPRTLADFMDGYEGPGLTWELYRVAGYKRPLPNARSGFVEREVLDYGSVRRKGYRNRVLTEKDIVDKYGGGDYRVVIEGPDERPRGQFYVRIPGEPVAEECEHPYRRRSVLAATFDLTLRNLSALMLSACDLSSNSAPSEGAVRSTIDAWLAHSSLLAYRLPADYNYYRAHEPPRWQPLMTVFRAMTDVQIYDAHVADGMFVARAMTRDGIMKGIAAARAQCEEEDARVAGVRRAEAGTWYLWLDDERDPRAVLAADNGEACLGERYAQYVNADLLAVGWCWAKSAEEAIRMVEARGRPRVMALDHDLGEAPYQPPPTAMSFLRWLSDNEQTIPEWYVHSANPVGRANIESFLRSWAKSQTLPETPTAFLGPVVNAAASRITFYINQTVVASSSEPTVRVEARGDAVHLAAADEVDDEDEEDLHAEGEPEEDEEEEQDEAADEQEA